MKVNIVEELIDLESVFNNMIFDDKNIGDKLELLRIMGDVETLINKHNINLKYNNVELRNSNIHGMGLFATCDIPKNKIVTLYPAHSVSLINYKEKQRRDLTLKGSNKFIENIDYYQNIYSLGEYNTIFGYYEITGDPNQIDNKLFIGHMLNDGIGNIFEDIPYEELKEDLELCEQIFDEYENEKINNCDIKILTNNPIGCIVTNRSIKAGEELLTQYGLQYWYGIEYPHVNLIEREIKILKLKIHKYTKNSILLINN